MSLLRKRYDFAYGKSYDMIALLLQTARQGIITWRSRTGVEPTSPAAINFRVF